MAKVSRGSDGLPEWKRPAKKALEDARDNAARSIQTFEALLEEQKRHHAEIEHQLSAFLGDDAAYLQTTQVNREFVGKSLDESILLVLDQEGRGLLLEEIYARLRKAGVLLSYSSEGRARDAIEKSVEHWGSSPDQRRRKLAKREKTMGKPIQQDPQTLKVANGLIGRVDWADDKFHNP
jgi:hypothetical protein